MDDELDRRAFAEIYKLWQVHKNDYPQNVKDLYADGDASLSKFPQNSQSFNLFVRLSHAIVDEMESRYITSKGGDRNVH